MRDGQWRLAVAAVETAFLVALALGVALRMAGQGAPTVENALVAGAVVMAAVALARFIWLAPLPDTAARRAAPRTLLGMPIRTAAYAAGPGAELGGGLLVLAALLSAASGLAALSAAAIPAPLAQWAGWTGRLVFLFAAVNLAPGLPFEGGRALRSVIWWWTGDLTAATNVAAGAGQSLGALVAIGGLAVAFAGDLVTGAGLLLAGALVNSGAGVGGAVVRAVESVRPLRMRDALIRPRSTLGRFTSLTEALERYAALGGSAVFPVLEGERFVGALTLESVLATPAALHPVIDAQTAMIERAMLFCAAPGDSLTGALDRRARRQGFVPVLEGERLAGVVLPEAVLRQAEQGQVGSKQAAA